MDFFFHDIPFILLHLSIRMSAQTPVSTDASHARPSAQSRNKTSKAPAPGPKPSGPVINFQYQSHAASRPATTNRPSKTIVAEPIHRTNFLASAFRILVDSSAISQPSTQKALLLPDHFVEWQYVRLVLLPACLPPPTCAICLEQPIAPKITQCGHIFCYSCMIQYHYVNDKTWCRCPLCFEMTKLDNLRTLQVMPARSSMMQTANKTIEFSLQRRSRTLMSCMPIDMSSSAVDPRDFCPVLFIDDHRQIVQHEQMQLLDAISLYTKNNDEHSALFARMALQHLQSIEHSLGDEFFADNELLFAAAPEISDSIAPESVVSVSAVPMPALSGPASPWSNIVTGKPSQYQIQQHLLYQQQEDERQAELERLNRQRLIRERGFVYPSVTFPHSVVNVDPNDPFIYYQQADGQYVFLNSLSYRCLAHHFDTLPAVISLPILASDALRQTAQTRERFKFLAHLPLGVPFELVDIDVAAVCGPETLAHFASELKARQQQRVALQKQRRQQHKPHHHDSISSPLASLSVHDFPEFVTAEQMASRLQSDQEMPALSSNPIVASSNSANDWSKKAKRGVNTIDEWTPLPSKSSNKSDFSQPPIPTQTMAPTQTLVPVQAQSTWSSFRTVGAAATLARQQQQQQQKQKAEQHVVDEPKEELIPTGKKQLLFSNSGGRRR